MSSEVNIFRPQQLQAAEIAKAALQLHYAGKKFPVVVNDLEARTKAYYHRIHIGGSAGAAGKDRHNFFNIAQSPTAPFASNFTQANAPGDQFFIVMGIQLVTAVGASDADAEDILDYGVPFDGEVLNGVIDFDVNNVEVLKDLPIGPAFINDEALPGYFPLIKPIVWEPDNKIDLEMRMADVFAAATYRYAKFILWGIELAK